MDYFDVTGSEYKIVILIKNIMMRLIRIMGILAVLICGCVSGYAEVRLYSIGR